MVSRTLLLIAVFVILISNNLLAFNFINGEKNNSGAKIQVTWGDSVINNNDLIPDSSNGTHFGTVYVTAGNINNGFSIKNIGTDTLRLNGEPFISIEGSNSSDFKVYLYLGGDIIPPGKYSWFSIAFDPVGTGERTANVTIKNSDPENNSFTFAIGGKSIQPYEDVTSTFKGISTKIQAVGSDGSYIGRSSSNWGDYDSDGDLDLVLTGFSNKGLKTKIYKNEGNNLFNDIEADIVQIGTGFAEWGDYDNDNDLDLIVTGLGSPVQNGERAIIYQNNGNDHFTEAVILDGVSFSNTNWGDYDNDGDLDLIINGQGAKCTLYENEGNNSFKKQQNSFNEISDAVTSFGDFDNDGDLDLIAIGAFYTRIYDNLGNGIFRNLNKSFLGFSNASVDLGDYDNDGDLDIIVSGFQSNSDQPPFGSTKTMLLKNFDLSKFEEVDHNLENVTYGGTRFGDFNNDGLLDIVLVGNNMGYKKVCKIYSNLGDDKWNEFTNLLGLSSSSVSWGDYDNDGDLDLITVGDYNSRPGLVNSSMQISQIYENKISTKNTHPTHPTNLKSELIENTVLLSWDKADDNETNQNSLTYNIYMGTKPGTTDVVTPMADIQSGRRRIVKMGNANLNTSWRIKNLEYGKTYYWSVQSIDNSFEGSKFAEEQSFYLDFPPKIVDLILPLENDTLDNYNIQFRWTKLHKYYGDSLKYNVNISSSVNDTTISVINGTSIYFYGENWIVPGIEYKWSVSTKYNNIEITSNDTLKFVKRKLNTGTLSDTMLVLITNKKDSISYYDSENNPQMKIFWEDGVIKNEVDTIRIGIKSSTLLPVNEGSENYELSKTFLIEPKSKDIINFYNLFRVRIYTTSDLFKLSEISSHIDALRVLEESSVFKDEYINSIHENWVEFSISNISSNTQFLIAATKILFGDIFNDTYKPIITGDILVPKNKTAILNEGVNWISSDNFARLYVEGELICNGKENNPIDLDNTRIIVEGDSISANDKIKKIECNWLNTNLIDINRAKAVIRNSKIDRLYASINSEVYSGNSTLKLVNTSGAKVTIENCIFDSSGYIYSKNSVIKVKDSEFIYTDYSSGYDSSFVYIENNQINLDAKTKPYNTNNSFVIYKDNKIIKAGDPENYYEKNGIEFNSNNYVVVRNNIIKGFYNGIFLRDNNKVVIFNNTFADNSSGIGIDESKDTLCIANNIFYNQKLAMNFDESYSTQSNLAYIKHNLWKEYDPEITNPFIRNKNNSTIVVNDSSSIHADPLFINEKEYYLENNSPAIDKGLSVIPSFYKQFSVLDTTIIAEDKIMIDSFTGKNPDIGAKESDLITNIGETKELPNVYKLYQNYPNPFNPNTIITYSLAKNEQIKLELFDILGQKIKIIVNDYKTNGTHEVNFNGSNLPSGVYIYRIQTRDFVDSKKMILLK